MKKKIIAGIMSMMLVVAMALPVTASETKTTTLQAAVPSTYTLSIPLSQSITLDATSTDIGTIEVTGNIKTTEKVVVTVGTTAFANKDKLGDTIAYTLVDGDAIFTGAQWSETDLQSASPLTYDLAVEIAESQWKSASAGNYEAVITFTAVIE